jgi:hypothetical protein
MVRGRIEKDFATAWQNNAVDFDQLLEMVAVGFPKCVFDFQHLTQGHA